MTGSLALEFNGDMVAPSIVVGLGLAGIYGLIAVAVVLSFRISRTVAFVHGGILLLGTLIYWYFTPPLGGMAALEGSEGTRGPILGHWPALIVCVLLGVVIAVGYGMAITSERLSSYPKVTLTTFSLGIMLILAGIAFTVVEAQGELVDSVFGAKTFNFMGGYMSSHDVATLVILGALVVGFNIVIKSTRFGIYMRAIADNVEASRLVGVPMGKVGIAVYAMSGAISALSGVLLASTVGTDRIAVLLVFLRALMICVIGAFGSIPLALIGAVVIASLENILTAQVFGDLGTGGTELVIIGVLFGVVFMIDRFGNKGKQVLESESM